MTAVLNHIQSRINEAQIINYPYPHLLIDNFFPDSIDFNSGLYGKMLTFFPDSNWQNNGTNLAAGDISGDWKVVRDEIYPAVMKMLENKFVKQIKDKIDELTKYNYFLSPPSFDDGEASIQLLQRDASFYIEPHIHAPSEYLSVLHYLPETNEHADAGTQMYPLKKPYELNVSWNTYPHVPKECLGEPIIAPYAPNTAVVWVSNFKAIHGRAMTNVQRRYAYAYKLFNPSCVNWNLGYLKVRQEV